MRIMTNKKKNKRRTQIKKSNISVASNNEIYISNGGAKLVLPEDTIRRVLHEYKDKLSKNSNWVGLLSATIPLWVAVFTSKFESEILFGLYIGVCIFFTIWTVYSITVAIKNNSKDLITDVVDRLKECSTRTK